MTSYTSNRTSISLLNPMDLLLYGPPFPLIDDIYWKAWNLERWTWAIYIPVIYVVLVYAGQRLMKNRQRFELKTPLFYWNVILSVGSTLAVLGILPEVTYLLNQKDGWHHSICTKHVLSPYFLFLELLAVWSKIVEFGDTVFIILRKSPLILLHWFHHASIQSYMWYTYSDNDPALRWFMLMNGSVHAVMYAYYAFRAKGVKVPRTISMALTTLQILQMIAGLIINSYTLLAAVQGTECSRKVETAYLAFAMYGAYLILFGRFFIESYITTPLKKMKKSQ